METNFARQTLNFDQVKRMAQERAELRILLHHLRDLRAIREAARLPRAWLIAFVLAFGLIMTNWPLGGLMLFLVSLGAIIVMLRQDLRESRLKRSIYFHARSVQECTPGLNMPIPDLLDLLQPFTGVIDEFHHEKELSDCRGALRLDAALGAEGKQPRWLGRDEAGMIETRAALRRYA